MVMIRNAWSWPNFWWTKRYQKTESTTTFKTSYGHGYLGKQFATNAGSTISEYGYHNFYSRPPELIFDGKAQLTTVVLELASGSASEKSYGHGCLEEQFTTNPRNTVSECGYHNFYSRPPESIFDGGAQLTTVVLELASGSTSEKSYGHGYLEKQFATTPKSTISEYGYQNFYSRPPELIFDGKIQLTTVVFELASYHNFYSRPPELIFDGKAQLTTVVLQLASSSTSKTSYGHGYLGKQFTPTLEGGPGAEQ